MKNSQNGLVMHTRFIRMEDLKGVLDAVRTEILRWSMKLEKDGIVGEGMTFSAEERRIASAIHYNSHFHAPVGNVAQYAEQISQTASIGIQPEELAKLVTHFSAHLSE
jgi:AbiTii